MSEPLVDGQPGWLVLDPDGNVVSSGPQTVTEASTDAGEDQAAVAGEDPA
jgi:hypothetical protein